VPVSVDEIADRLYALPPEEFTQARNRAERELRAAGEREQADEVKALRKPTAAAGAVNRLVHGQRAQVEAFLEAAAGLRDAQVAGKGDLSAAARAERAALDELVAVGGESVRGTLQAAAVDDEVARELLRARLVREPEPAGFGTLLAHAEPASAAPARGKPRVKPSAASAAPAKRRAPAPSRPDVVAARTRLQEAKKALTAAAAEERHAQREVERAQAAVQKAQRELDRLRGH